MTTLDFELEIGPGVAGNYPVVERASGGEAATTLRWPFTAADLDHLIAVIKDKVLVSSAVVRRAPTEDAQSVRELGQRLFDALVADDVQGPVCSQQTARSGERQCAAAGVAGALTGAGPAAVGVPVRSRPAGLSGLDGESLDRDW